MTKSHIPVSELASDFYRTIKYRPCEIFFCC